MVYARLSCAKEAITRQESDSSVNADEYFGVSFIRDRKFHHFSRTLRTYMSTDARTLRDCIGSSVAR